MKEIFKDYFVNKLGEVFSKKYGELRKMKPNIVRGYHRVDICIEGKKKHFLVHRLVALAFIPNPENKKQVNHINGIKTDNRLENLEWVTSSENMRHADNTGLRNIKGAAHGSSKLTEDQVIAIRNDPRTQRIIGKEYGVSFALVSLIKLRKQWKHI
jgi:HNH endonuclease